MLHTLHTARAHTDMCVITFESLSVLAAHVQMISEKDVHFERFRRDSVGWCTISHGILDGGLNLSSQD